MMKHNDKRNFLHFFQVVDFLEQEVQLTINLPFLILLFILLRATAHAADPSNSEEAVKG